MKYVGCRVVCSQCKYFVNRTCKMLKTDQIKINEKNNVCRKFQHRIVNPSSPDFNFDDYLEWLGTDYYRPYTIDKNNIIGSARLGEVIMDGGHLAELLPSIYSPFYETVDKPWCRKHMPRCHAEYEDHKFEIDYVKYREGNWITEDSIKFDQHLWKDRVAQRKYQREFNGIYKI
ncbi:hypothetical protein COJ29_12315 [Bacillus cereus]|nr:hypothetical protein COJ12_25845 [Bacillus cereus]PFK91864.1 hypothetical protein COJ29_12315 [Bacillus cereus]PFM48345.1 hypothetical protein COJ49_27000 [Bacillus cereus]PGZ57649.1 hypothetical protein COF02_28010 [Bacillus cereus]